MNDARMGSLAKAGTISFNVHYEFSYKAEFAGLIFFRYVQYTASTLVVLLVEILFDSSHLNVILSNFYQDF